MPLKRATGQVLLRSQLFLFSISAIAVAIFCFYLGVAYAKGSRDGEWLCGVFAACFGYISILAGMRIWSAATSRADEIKKA